MQAPPTILRKIMQRKQQEILERQARTPLQVLQRQIEQTPVSRGFLKHLRQTIAKNQLAVIAEIKRASPSKGLLRADLNPAVIARSYEQAGAAAISVLTDVDFFKGSDEDLKQVKAACHLPILRKDFVIDPYQVYEAKAIGADCILLIVACLDDQQLKQLADLAKHLDLDVLIEVHDKVELQRALAIDPPLIGINNRDLHSFETRLETTYQLLPDIPAHCLVVTESGIQAKAQIAALRKEGVQGFLVGEVFMQAEDPGQKLKELFFVDPS